MQKLSSKLLDRLKEQFKDSILGAHNQCGDETVIVKLNNFKLGEGLNSNNPL